MTFGFLREIVESAYRRGAESDSQVKIKLTEGQEIDIGGFEINTKHLFGERMQLVIKADTNGKIK